MNKAADAARAGKNPEKPPINPYISIIILTLATFMEVLDTTVANVALPRIAGDLSVSPDEAIWIIGSYLVANAAILPISGWLATYFGRKRYYMACVFIFTVSSVLCGFATSLESLVFFRIIQGLSGGGLAPSEQAIIADITPPDKLGRAFSIYGFGLAVAPVIGPTLGGFITDVFSWHWIFFINLPIGIVSLILTGLFVKESKQAEETREKFRKEGNTVDWMGIGLFVLGIAALEIFLEKGPKEGWFESDFVFATAIVAFFAILIGITWELYQKQPAVDVLMFKNRAFAGALILIFTVGFVTTGSVFIVPFMAQTLLGYTAMDAGMVGLPAAIVLLLMIQIVGYLIDKFDVRMIILFGLIVSGLAVWNLTSINLQVDFYTLAWARAFQSLGLAFLAVSINTAAYYDISPEKNNSASALLNLARNTGASVGIAVTSTIIALRTQVHINNLSYHTTNFNPNFVESLNQLTQSLKQQGLTALQAASAARGVMWERVVEQASMKAILDTFQVYLILFVCVLPLVFLLKRKKSNASPNGH
jgi:MFS transporter, DHA2 family, multidrug resistance protein